MIVLHMDMLHMQCAVLSSCPAVRQALDSSGQLWPRLLCRLFCGNLRYRPMRALGEARY